MFIKDPKSDETITVTKADKENSVVVINRTDYQNQVTKMLEDKTVYKHITDKRRKPTTKTELELEKILKDLKRSENLTKQEYWQLRWLDTVFKNLSYSLLNSCNFCTVKFK